jgi:hypothetical protein
VADGARNSTGHGVTGWSVMALRVNSCWMELKDIAGKIQRSGGGDALGSSAGAVAGAAEVRENRVRMEVRRRA